MRLAIETREARKLTDRLHAWKLDIPRFVHEVFRVTPDPWQREVFEAFPRHQRVALVACSNPGKTFVEAMIAWNYLATREQSQIAATAVSRPNLKANLWKEMAYWHGRSPLLRALFDVGTERIAARGFEKTWFMDARAWNRDSTPEEQGKVLAGLHAPYLLFILDEAGGIPTAVSRVAENALGDASCKEAHVLIAGNPIELSGALYEAAVERRSRWWVKEISGDPDDPNRAPRVSLDWAREQIEDLGRESAYVQAYVLGKFPTSATDALVSLNQFDKAFERWDARDGLAIEPRTLGVDVARHGSDRTVVWPRAGDLAYFPRLGDRDLWWQGQDTTYTAGRVVEIANAWAGTIEAAKRLPIYVDDIGVGGGVTDQILSAGYRGIGVNVGASPTSDEEHMHANLKSQISLDVQERFRRGLIAIDPEVKRRTSLVAEGSAMKVSYSAGRRKVEGKDEYKRRTGRSTDFWDAFMLAFTPLEAVQTPEERFHALLEEEVLRVRGERAAAEKAEAESPARVRRT